MTADTVWRRNRLAVLTSTMIRLLAIALLAGAWVLLLLGVDPVPTWFYVFAWYPTLVLADDLTRRRFGGRVFSDPRTLGPMLGWSAAIWLLFEAANFRLANWYYVFLPAHPVERWAGIALAFATVVPAVFLAARLFDRLWDGPIVSTRMTIGNGQLRAAELTGLAFGALALTVPHLFFPLIWGAVWLAADPWLYRRRPEWSLLGDLERGDWGRTTKLLAGGLLVGLLWEFYNYWARGKWIYTVPWLEEVKLFEMPPFGFVGFPVFALEAWTLYHVVCALGLARPVDVSARRLLETAAERKGAPTRSIRTMIVAACVAFSVFTLAGMERFTNSSTVPALSDVPGLAPPVVAAMAAAGFGSPFDVAHAGGIVVADRAGLTSDEAARVVRAVELTLFRGIGAAHAARLHAFGITSVCALRNADADDVVVRVRRPGAVRPTAAEVRVWIRAATRRCGE